jgi:hypothetical protein
MVPALGTPSLDNVRSTTVALKAALVRDGNGAFGIGETGKGSAAANQKPSNTQAQIPFWYNSTGSRLAELCKRVGTTGRNYTT